MTGVRLNIKQLFSNPRALDLPALQVARNLHTITSTQSDAFILAAVIVCIIGPIVFNSVYKLDKSDLIKQRVVILGANTITVPIAQQLSKNWYVIRMVTDNEENYKTFNSEVNDLTYLPEIDETTLDKGDLFDTDILVASFRNDRKNLRLAQLAKKRGVSRVIASQQNPNVNHERIDELIAQGVEIFNAFNVETSVLRSMIESPSIIELLSDTEAGLFEVVVRNQRYAGQELHTLPIIDKITVSRIYRNHKPISPHGDTIIELGDHILFTGNHLDAETARNELRRKN